MALNRKAEPRFQPVLLRDFLQNRLTKRLEYATIDGNRRFSNLHRVAAADADQPGGVIRWFREGAFYEVTPKHTIGEGFSCFDRGFA